MTAMDTWDVDELFATIRRAAPFAELSRARRSKACSTCCRDATRPTSSRSCGRASPGTASPARSPRARAPSAWRSPTAARFQTAALRRLPGRAPVRARRASASSTRKWCSRAASGETFVLGASSWRIEEITHDRVLVSPAPGEPGKMPFWKGDRAGRPLELGLAIGRLMHDLLRLPPAAAIERLTRDHDLDAQRGRKPPAVPARPDGRDARGARCRRRSSIERVRDELGDWRVCVLSPRGGRIHAPWAMAVAGEDPRGDRRRRRDPVGRRRVRRAVSGRAISRPIRELLLPDPDEVQALVVRQLGATALFAAKFRENAARSLLLPKRRPGHARAALAAAQARRPICWRWRRATDRFRCCSKPIASAFATSSTCRRWSRRSPTSAAGRSAWRRSIPTQPSPFAASLLFSYVASFLYDGDAPLAERRAQALAVDQAQLRELLGDAELRELLDADSMDGARAPAPAPRPAVPRARAPTASTTCCWRSAI